MWKLYGHSWKHSKKSNIGKQFMLCKRKQLIYYYAAYTVNWFLPRYENSNFLALYVVSCVTYYSPCCCIEKREQKKSWKKHDWKM